MNKIKAFIPAAGYGERLRPVTLHLPKPLLPVLGVPVIETVLDRLSALSVDRVGINIHYKPEMLKEWGLSTPYAGKITLFHEEPILGTGGALKNAASLLGDAPFLVHNADIVSDIDLGFLIREHFESGNVATLAVHDHPAFNNVWIDGDGSLRLVESSPPRERRDLRPVAFTGIAVYSADFLRFLPDGISSVVDAWLRATDSGMRIGTVDMSCCRWSDIGTPDAYAGIVFEALKERGEVIHVDPSAACHGTRLRAQAVIERGCIIGRGALINQCIVLPGARIADGAEFKDAIIGPGYVVPLGEQANPAPFPPFSLPRSLGDAFEGSTRISLIGTGGSDRNYYRIRAKNRSAVLMVCPKDDPDLQRHLSYTEFFRKQTVPVPELLLADEAFTNSKRDALRYLLFEDLGDISLYSWLKCRRTREAIEALYRRVIDILVHLHSAVSAGVSDCPALEARLFDYDHLRWETAYFCERFVCGHLLIALPQRGELDHEFDRLARLTDSFPKSIVHRDFQSQNIMVTDDNLPRIIDFQGARIGPPAYDLVSLLWDPYHRLDDAMRERLADYYIFLRKKASADSFDETTFRNSLLPCRLQRHMQALGAYGFLSKVKGKTYFEKYIPQAVRYLKEEAAAAADIYPHLCRLAGRISEKIVR